MLKNTIKILTLFLFVITTFSIANAATQVQMGNGYTIQIPDGFLKDKALSYEGTDIFSNKECNITVSSRRMSKYDVKDIKVQASEIEKQYKLSKFKIIKNTVGEVKNFPMFRIKYSIPNSKGIRYQCGIIADDIMFMMTFAAPSDNDKKYEAQFDKIINTFSK